MLGYCRRSHRTNDNQQRSLSGTAGQKAHSEASCPGCVKRDVRLPMSQSFTYIDVAGNRADYTISDKGHHNDFPWSTDHGDHGVARSFEEAQCRFPAGRGSARNLWTRTGARRGAHHRARPHIAPCTGTQTDWPCLCDPGRGRRFSWRACLPTFSARGYLGWSWNTAPHWLAAANMPFRRLNVRLALAARLSLHGGYCKPAEDLPPVAHVWRTCVRAAAARLGEVCELLLAGEGDRESTRLNSRHR